MHSALTEGHGRLRLWFLTSSARAAVLAGALGHRLHRRREGIGVREQLVWHCHVNAVKAELRPIRLSLKSSKSLNLRLAGTAVK
jgi:hypothetical protein